ncbi:hypothetical protein M8J76_013955 [Diaphorina citri]|nr:hypothetical protein M8J76_013955 [Diaphorina citri]
MAFFSRIVTALAIASVAYGVPSFREKREESQSAAANPLSQLSGNNPMSYLNGANNPMSSYLNGANNPMSSFGGAFNGLQGSLPTGNFPGLGSSSTRSKREESQSAAANPLSQLSGNNPMASYLNGANNPMSSYLNGANNPMSSFGGAFNGLQGSLPTGNFPGLGSSSTRSKREESQSAAANPLSQLSGNNPMASYLNGANNPMSSYLNGANNPMSSFGGAFNGLQGSLPTGNFPGLGSSSTRSKREESQSAAANPLSQLSGNNPMASYLNGANNPMSSYLNGANNPMSSFGGAFNGLQGSLPTGNFPGLGSSSTRSKREESQSAAANPLSQLSGNNPMASYLNGANNPMSSYLNGANNPMSSFGGAFNGLQGSLPTGNFPGLGSSSTRSKREESQSAAANPLSQLSGNNPMASYLNGANNPMSSYLNGANNPMSSFGGAFNGLQGSLPTGNFPGLGSSSTRSKREESQSAAANPLSQLSGNNPMASYLNGANNPMSSYLNGANNPMSSFGGAFNGLQGSLPTGNFPGLGSSSTRSKREESQSAAANPLSQLSGNNPMASYLNGANNPMSSYLNGANNPMSSFGGAFNGLQGSLPTGNFPGLGSSSTRSKREESQSAAANPLSQLSGNNPMASYLNGANNPMSSYLNGANNPMSSFGGAFNGLQGNLPTGNLPGLNSASGSS